MTTLMKLHILYPVAPLYQFVLFPDILGLPAVTLAPEGVPTQEREEPALTP